MKGHIQKRALSWVLSLYFIAAFAAIAQTPAPKPEGAENVPENKTKVAPLVIMENTALTGRIIFMQEDDMDETPGVNLKVKISTQNRRKAIYETKTDEQGQYQIPKLAADTYWMEVGQLRLRLRVNPIPLSEEQAETGSATNLPSPKLEELYPKVLVIFIPRDLG